MVQEVGEKVAGICKRLQIYIFKSSSQGQPHQCQLISRHWDERALTAIHRAVEKWDCPPPPIYMHTRKLRWQRILWTFADTAFLCRQTDLLLAAGKTGRIVNGRSGQFVNR
jgi:2-dehydro-3-deoxyphosphooctonate aldolase (KDO 8-P synthase)